MISSGAKKIYESFKNEWLCWVALRHLLPSPLLLELLTIITEQISDRKLKFENLFHAELSEGNEALATLLLWPVVTDSALGSYLQRCFRSIAWQNDAFVSGDGVDQKIDTSGWSVRLEHAISLGLCDLETPGVIINNLKTDKQSAAKSLLELILIAQSGRDKSTVAQIYAKFVATKNECWGPLGAIILKHIGDLYADVDAWDCALALYEKSEAQLLEQKISRHNYYDHLQAILNQSHASALWNVAGAAASIEYMEKRTGGGKSYGQSVVSANGSHDASVARFMSNHEFLGYSTDRRAVVMLPPLLQVTHSASAAVKSWSNGKFDDASRYFSGVLRRQIALGISTDIKETKSFFANNLFDDLLNAAGGGSDPTQFKLALRLLIESERYEFIKKIRWSEELVRAYITEDILVFATTHAVAQVGATLGRQQVIVQLLLAWLKQVDGSKADLAQSMLGYLLVIAEQSQSTFIGNFDLGGQSLSAIEEISKCRPELLQLVETRAVALVKLKLRSKNTRDNEFALKIALECSDLFSRVLILDLALAILEFLATINLQAGYWPILQPALNFLLSGSVNLAVRDNVEARAKIISTALTLSQQDTQKATILVKLSGFDPGLVQDPIVKEQLGNASRYVRERLKSVDASDAVHNIQTIFLSSQIVGASGVEEALQALNEILELAIQAKPTISFSDACLLILTIISKYNEISGNASNTSLHSALSQMLELVLSIWERAKSNPEIFSTFSIPRSTVPNPIVVHNWAFASLTLANFLKRNSDIKIALENAKSCAALREGITLAYATKSIAEPKLYDSLQAILTEDRETFYAALGRRLAAMQMLPNEERQRACKLLVEHCLKHGPREADAAVFISAINAGLKGEVGELQASVYTQRLGKQRQMRLTVLPVLEALQKA